MLDFELSGGEVDGLSAGKGAVSSTALSLAKRARAAVSCGVAALVATGRHRKWVKGAGAALGSIVGFDNGVLWKRQKGLLAFPT